MSAGKSSDLGLPLGYLVCCSDLTEVRVLAAAADKAATRRRGRNLDERGSISPLISEGTFIYLFERIPYIYIYVRRYMYEGTYVRTKVFYLRNTLFASKRKNNEAYYIFTLAHTYLRTLLRGYFTIHSS